MKPPTNWDPKAQIGHLLNLWTASILALAALVAVPWLLSLVGWPLPTSVPTVSPVTDALGDRFVPGDMLVKGLGVACWLLWFEVTASVLASGESVTDVTGPGGPVVQQAG